MHLAISLAVLLGSALATATTSRNSTISNTTTIIPGAYIVEFVGGNDHTSFYRSLRADGVDVSPRMNMSFQLFNGSSFSITNLTEHTTIASKISLMPSVKRIWPLRLYPAPKFQHANTAPFPSSNGAAFVSKQRRAATTGNSSYSPHVMTQVDRLHAAGYTGKGARIAIVDTGVDYNHPALGGCFGEGCLISGGYDLAGHGYDGSGAPKPGPDPYDSCDGHGTHVAGIIGARPNEMGFTGVAPGASISMYKVFSCEGYTFGSSDDILISAFNMAFEDGADIITASIGGPGGWSEEPWSSVVGRIVENGVPCTLAAGNSGSSGMWAPSSAADGKDVTAVSSFDNAITPYLLYEGSYSTNASSSGSCSPSSKSFAWLPSDLPLKNLTLPLWVRSHDATAEDDVCASLPSDTPDLSNFIVLIRMNAACDPYDQLSNVSAFNAQYVLFYGSTMDDLSIFDEYYLPYYAVNGVGAVAPEQGEEWVDLLRKQHLEVRLTITDPLHAGLVYKDAHNTLTGGSASDYTSWGPTFALDVYPSLGAPGGNILSTYLLSQGGYRVASGTSMATPFMAAVYALVGEARGTFDPTELAMYLSSTSNARRWNDGSGTLDGLAPVAQQGAGLVQAYDAAFVTTHLSTKGISFNDTDHFRSAIFTIRNLGSQNVTYELGNSPAYSMNSLSSQSNYPETFPNSIIASTADLEFSKTSVMLPPRSRANITVEPTFADSPVMKQRLLPVYSGYITINGSNGDNLAIPYLGVRGSMYSAEVMTTEGPWSQPDEFDSPWTGMRSSCQGNTTFTVPYPPMDDTIPLSPTDCSNYPSAEFYLNFGTRLLRADVVPLSYNYTGPTKTVLGLRIAGSVYGYPQEWQSRLFFWVGFSGKLDDGSVVPEGEYALAIRALKLFGDPDEPDDYDDLGLSRFTLFYQG